MQIAALFREVIENSEYLGEYSYSDLLSHTSNEKINGLGTSEINSKSIILVFVNGEPEGAAQIDEHGMLYGDKAIYILDKSSDFRLFKTGKELADSISSRCRIFDKSHLKTDNFSSELHDLVSFSTRPAKLKLIINKDSQPAGGLKVIMAKDLRPVKHDTTSSDGAVWFVLQGGEYTIIVIEKDRTEHRFSIKT